MEATSQMQLVFGAFCQGMLGLQLLANEEGLSIKPLEVPELKARAVQAGAALNGLLRSVFANRCLPQTLKRCLFVQLVQTKLLHHAATWSFRTQKERQTFHTIFMQLLRRTHQKMFGQWQRQATDAQVVHDMQTLWPEEMLQIERLRHYSTLLRHGPPMIWAMLRVEESWLEQLRFDVQWALEIATFQGYRGQLLDSDCAAFEQCIIAQPEAWKHFLKTIVKKLQRRSERLSLAFAWEGRMCEGLAEASSVVLNDYAVNESGSPKTFACATCLKVFDTAAKLAAHQNTQHKQRSAAYKHARGTQCLACLREYHSTRRLQDHLRLTRQCLARLQEAEIDCPELEGNIVRGVTAFKPVVRLPGPAAWWATLDPVAAACPPTETACPSQSQAIASVLTQSLPSEQPCGEAFVRFVPMIVRAMLPLLKATDANNDLRAEHVQQAIVLASCACDPTFVARVVASAAWVLLSKDEYCYSIRHAWQATRVEGKVLITDLAHLALGRLAQVPTHPKYVLLLYADKRSECDIQYYLEGLSWDWQVPVVCLPVNAAGGKRGSLPDRTSCCRLLHLIRAVHVLGAVAAPPYESWTEQRSNNKGASVGKPRGAVRSRQHPWGQIALSSEEHLQVTSGSDLLHFALEVFLTCYNCQVNALLAHPSRPEKASSPSIWRLPIVRHMLSLPGIRVIELMQGWMGAPNPSPTFFLVYNMPLIEEEIGARADFKPADTHQDAFRQTVRGLPLEPLAFPGPLCDSIAHSFVHAARARPAATSGS